MLGMRGKVKWPLLLAAVLVLLVAFAGTALAADWPKFQKDNYNSGLAADSPPVSANPTFRMVDLPNAAWFGTDVTPLIVTEEEDGEPVKYVYILNSTSSDARVYKIRCSDRTTPDGWTNGVVVDSNGGFQLATPVISGTTMYLGLSDQQQKLTNTTFDSNMDGWTSYTEAGSPTIAWDSNGGDGCVKINQPNASTATRGGIYQTASINATDKVRVTLRYKVDKTTGSNPTGVTIRIKASPDGTNWTTIYTKANPTLGSWQDVNQDVTTYFGSTANYTIKYEAEFTTAAGSDGYAKFDNCGLLAENLLLKKITGINTSSPSVSSVASLNYGGQFNTPLVYDNGNLYLGSWKGGGTGKYFKVDASSGTVTAFTPSTTGEGFYWAGAAVIGNYLVFGGDKSIVYVLNKSDMSLVTSYTIKGSGTGQESTAAEIRSSICYQDVSGTTADKIYFTDKGGFLWCLNIDSSTGALTHGWHVNIGYSTSTPVYVDGKVYVGQGSVGSGGKIYCRNSSDGSAVWEYTAAGCVQSSPVVKRDGNNTYIYYTTNSPYGKGYCLRDDGSTRTLIWTVPTGDEEGANTLQGMAASGEYVVFGNDKGEVYIVE